MVHAVSFLFALPAFIEVDPAELAGKLANRTEVDGEL
jgi:hypothetical protein